MEWHQTKMLLYSTIYNQQNRETAFQIRGNICKQYILKEADIQNIIATLIAQLQNKQIERPHDPIEKCSTDLHNIWNKTDIQMTNKYMGKHSISLTIREM